MWHSNQTQCPICGKESDFKRYIESRGEHWVRCANCGGGHKTPYVPETERPTLAERNYDAVYLQPAFFERRMKFAKNQAAWLAGKFRQGMAVVEIGPGLGLAAERFLQLLPGTPYYMVEPHNWFGEFVASRMGSRVQVFKEPMETSLDRVLAEAVSPTCRPVLLYMDNVLEHVRQPLSLLAKLKARLPRGSVALFDVPNERGLRWRHRMYLAIGGKTTVVPEHINLFTIKSFHLMLSGLALQHQVRQRGIRRPEEVNCLPEGALLSSLLGLLSVVPIDEMLGLANNLRVEVEF